jgi:chromosome segregation ATPase
MNDETKPEYPNARDCEHGQLRRKCEVCERDERIAELEKRLAEAEARAEALDVQLQEVQADYGELDGKLFAEVERADKAEALAEGYRLDAEFHKNEYADINTHIGGQLRDAVARADKAEADRDVAESRKSDVFREMKDRLATLEQSWNERGMLLAGALAKLKLSEEKASDIESDYDDLHEVVETLRADIEEHLPTYVLDDGTGDEANYRERIEFAGDDIRRLGHELRLSHEFAARSIADAKEREEAALARLREVEKSRDEWSAAALRDAHLLTQAHEHEFNLLEAIAAARSDAVREFAEWYDSDAGFAVVENLTNVIEAADCFLASEHIPDAGKKEPTDG